MYQDDQKDYSRRSDDEHQIREPQIRRPDLEDRDAEDTEENIQAEREAFFQDFNNARQQVHSTDHYADGSGSYAPYSDDAHGVGHYGDDDYYGDGYYDENYSDQSYSDPNYTDRNYAGRGYREDDDGYGESFQNQEQGQDYSEPGYDDGGYVDGGYVDGGYGDERYDGYRESGYDDYQEAGYRNDDAQENAQGYRPGPYGNDAREGYGRDYGQDYGYEQQGGYPSQGRPQRGGYPGQEGQRAPLVSRPDHDDELPPWRRIENEAPAQREPNPALEKLKEVSLESLKGFVLWVRDFVSSDPRQAVERAILGQEVGAVVPVLLLLALILPLYSLILFQHSVAGLNAQISAIQGLAPLLTGGRVYGMNILRYLLEFCVFTLLYWGTLHLLRRPRKLTEAMSAVAVSYFPLLTLLPLMIIFSFFLPTVAQALYAAGMMLQIIFLYHGVKFPLLEGESLAKMIELDESQTKATTDQANERAEDGDAEVEDSASDMVNHEEPGDVTRKLQLELKSGEETLPPTWVWIFMAFTVVAEILSHVIATIVVPGSGLF